MTSETKQLNATSIAKLTCFAADVEVGDNGENAKTVPVKILARTSDPVWVCDEESGIVGYMVHDFATMTTKNRVPLDYSHDQYQNIGFLNKIAVENNSLNCSGAVVPYSQNPCDPASEVVYKMKAGVPYEASIQTSCGDLLYADDGSLVTVNGRSYEGFSPVWVMSNWELKAVAICKLGRDPATSVDLNSRQSPQSKAVKVNLFKKESPMSVETNSAVEAPVVEVPAVETPTAEVVDAAVVEAPKVEAPSDEKKDEAVEATPAQEAPVVEAPKPEAAVQLNSAVPASADARSEAKQFITLFGATDGATYFADGLALNEAMAKHISVLSARNADLNQRLSSIDRGAPAPVQFSASPDDSKKPESKSFIRIQK